MVPNSETELEDFGRKIGNSACVVFKMMAETPWENTEAGYLLGRQREGPGKKAIVKGQG